MLAEINLRGEHIVAIAVFAFVFLPMIIAAVKIGKHKKNTPEWLNVSEEEFKKKVKSIVQEELKKERDLMNAKDL